LYCLHHQLHHFAEAKEKQPVNNAADEAGHSDGMFILL